MRKSIQRIAWASLVAMLLVPALASAQDVVVYYHTDAIGSVRAVTDDTGAVIARYDYLPFGEPWDPQPSPDVRQFAGKERDAETGLDYSGARYYRPQSGLFTTGDPGHAGGDIFNPQSWNAYAYALNNPFRFVDPFGLAPCPAPTDASTCVEGRKGSGEFVFDFTRWLFEAWFRQQWNSLGEPPPNGVYGGMPGPPLGRVAALLERPIMGAGRSTALVPYWPPNGGFAGTPVRTTLQPGTIVDRFGGTGGFYLSPSGTPAAARSLRPGTEGQPLTVYEVVKPLVVEAGPAASWFGRPGGGTQYYLRTRTVQDLIDSGYLRTIP